MFCDETGINEAAGNCVSFPKLANFKLQRVAMIPSILRKKRFPTRSRNEFTRSCVLLSKCLNFIQISDCWSDSTMRNKRPVERSQKCSAMKLEAVKQPEVVCRFPTGSGVSLRKLRNVGLINDTEQATRSCRLQNVRISNCGYSTDR